MSIATVKADALGHEHAELFRTRLMKFLEQILAPGIALEPPE